MKKRPFVAILNAIEAAGANVITDATAREWSVVTLSTNKENLIGPIRYGTGVRVEYFDPQAEVSQLVIIGAETTKETIVASTRYRVEVGNPENTYESVPNAPKVFAYTSSATLSGTAATDRAVVYRAIRDKINAYSGVFCTAYTLTYAAYTLGTDVGSTNTNFTIGETVTQETSTLTAKVAKCTVTGGTFVGDNAAGHIWLYNLSNETTWLTTQKTLTGTTSTCVCTVTNATTVHATGLAIVDNAGYFTSAIGRGGKSRVGVTQGFATDAPTVAIVAAYAMGIGSDMAALKPVYDHTKQDLIAGSLEYEFQAGTLVDTAKTYTKCVITVKDGSLDTNGQVEEGEKEFILYVYYSDGDLGNFKTALSAAVAL